MRKGALILGIIFLAVIFETSILPLFFPGKIAPDLILISLIASVIVFGFPAVWIWAVVAGFILDIFSFRRIGVSVLSFMTFCYAISFFSRRLLFGEKTGGILAGIVFVTIATFFHNLWIYSASAQFKFQDIWGIKLAFLEIIGWKIIFNIILFFISLLILKYIKNKNSRSNNLLLGR
jgi:rod shape-determining protein MreD